jgi:hypothetical protein
MQANKNHIIIPSMATELTHDSQGLVHTVPPSLASTQITHHEENSMLNVRFTQLYDDIKTHEAKLSVFLSHL